MLKMLSEKPRRQGEKFQSYYGRPILKKPHWVWHIWFYFWIGGIAAGAGVLAGLARLIGDSRRDRSIVRAGRYISIVGLIISPVLLILDLKRPERFFNMLRIVKFRSPLNLGTWILSASGVLAGLNAARQVVEDGLIPANSLPGKLALALPDKTLSGAQGIAGLALGSYTGVLLSATAVPLWNRSEMILGPLFLASSFSSGAAAISLTRTLSGVSEADLHRLDQLEQAAILTELGLLTVGAIGLSPQLRQPLSRGAMAVPFWVAVTGGQLLPLALQLLTPKKSKFTRRLQIFSSLLILTGAFLLRFSIVEGGKISAADPQAYHEGNAGEGSGENQD